jgi:putative transposase
MRKKREFIKGAFYHVTSRTNNKVHVFESELGQKIILLTLEDAKEKFGFTLTNFCIMPNHIHLLIRPENGVCLSKIMQWIKTRSAKRWNLIHYSKDHLWGDRYFSRAIKDMREYFHVMSYIDQNPVAAGLVSDPAEWKSSGAFYKQHGLTGLVDYYPFERFNYIKLLPQKVTDTIPDDNPQKGD